MKQIYFANRHECSTEIHFQKYFVHPLSSRGATPLILTTPNSNSQKVWVTGNMISPKV